MVNGKSEFIKNLFANLNSNQVDYFVLGEYHNLPERIENSDLDIVVSPIDVESFIMILKDLISKYTIKVVSYYTNSNAKFYRLLCESDTFWGLQLDLFCKGLYFQSKEYFPVAQLKKDVLLYNNIKVLDLKKTYFVGFLKEIIHNGCSKKKYINGFITEVLSDEIKYRKLLTELYSEEFTKIIFDNLSINSLKTEAKTLRKIMLSKIYDRKFVFLNYTLQRIKKLNRVLTSPGYTIVFLGVQSSRKAIITNITPILNEAFYNSVFCENIHTNRIQSSTNASDEKSSTEKFAIKSITQTPFTFTASIFRAFTYLFNYTIGYWIKIFPKKSFNSCVWIFDGYYYNYLINSKKTSCPNWIIKLCALIIPEPDLILCLGRSDELHYNKNIELNNHFPSLSQFCVEHKKAVWIDVDCSVEQSVNNAMKAIIEVMVKRFKAINQN